MSEVVNAQERFKVDTVADPGLDISTEANRTYIFPTGDRYTVFGPKRLWVKLSSSPEMAGLHSHRIETVDGAGIYIRAGWLAIEWHNNESTTRAVEF